MLMSIVGMVASSSQTTTIDDNSVLVIKLKGEITDRSNDEGNPFATLLGDNAESQGLYNIVEAINRAKENDNIKGIYIEAGQISAEPATVTALRDALKDIKKSKKFIVAYADQYSQGSYYISSVADKVWTNPQGMLAFHGMASQPQYMRDFLAKLGIKIQVVKVGQYKSATETYTEDHMSDANREQVTAYVSGIWNHMLKGIAESRKISVDSLNAYADQVMDFASTETLKKNKLIDGTLYTDQVKGEVKKLLKIDDGDDISQVSVTLMLQAKHESASSDNEIAVYFCEGNIVQEPAEGIIMGGGSSIIGNNVCKDLEKIAKDENVKAVVIRINSGGGDAYASEQMWHQIVELKKVKPVVISMGGMAASGGWRISVKTYDSFGSDFNIWVKNVSCDDKIITADNGTYVIPKEAKRIEIQAAVLNYTLSNPLVHLYFEGANDEGTTVYQDELTALTYTNLPYGRYKLHVEVLDGTTRETELDRVFDFYKEPKITELLWVRLLLVLAAMGFAAFIVWRVLLGTIIRRQNEELKVAKDEADRANTAKSRFLANMSHEIRTPINTILGMDEMILREDKSLPVKAYSSSVTGYARSIKRATESLLGLVNDILDLSKIESGKMNLVEREYDTAEFLRAITTMIRVKANEKDLLFNIDIDPLIPSKLYGDDGKIKQVLLNMLTNAVKYTKQGSFTLSLKLLGQEDGHCSIHYSVKDTGMGIRPEDMEKLFSAFERLDEKENTGIQGTGLGLNISRQFVELMGDELKCESEYGKGSEFFFTLRQRIVDETPMGEFSETEASTDEEEYVPLFVAPNARVLVVDDNEMNLLVLKSLLKETKVIIDTATSGKQCLDKINSADYDIILLDHMMPGMDGIETLHELRKTHPNIPVLALTANAVSGEEFYINEGFQGFLSKPVEGDRLEARLKEFLPPELLKEWTKEEAPEEPAVKSGEAGDEDPRFKALSAIEDMDLSQGIRYCGSKDSYFAALENFRDALPERYSEIENAYEGEDWEFYTIKVHALKSSARMVGLSALSDMSKEMEDAGREGNIDAIREKTEKLLSLYKEIGEKLEDADLTGRKEDRPLADEGTINDALEAIRDMAASMDYDSIEMVLDEIKGYSLSEQDAKMFKELNKHLKALDWEGIQEILG